MCKYFNRYLRKVILDGCFLSSTCYSLVRVTIDPKNNYLQKKQLHVFTPNDITLCPTIIQCHLLLENRATKYWYTITEHRNDTLTSNCSAQLASNTGRYQVTIMIRSN